MQEPSVYLQTPQGDTLSVCIEDERRAVIAYISLKTDGYIGVIVCVIFALLFAPYLLGNSTLEIVVLYLCLAVLALALWRLGRRAELLQRKRVRMRFLQQLEQQPPSLARDVAQLIVDSDFVDWHTELRERLLPGVRTIATGVCISNEQSKLYEASDPNEPVPLQTKGAKCWIARGRVAVQTENSVTEFSADDTLLVHVDEFEGEWATMCPHDGARRRHTFDDADTNLCRLWTWWNAPGPPAPPLKDRIPQ